MRVRLLVAAALVAGGCTSQPAPRDTLVVAYASGPVSFTPNTANEEITLSVLGNVYEALVEFDAKLAAAPLLAESWHTENDLTWVFRLREGARFHDGSPVEAADVVRSLEWARSAPESKRRAELAEISAVTALDARTVSLRTTESFGGLPHRLGAIMISKPGPDPQGPPLGTGPYRIVQATPAVTVLEAVATGTGRPPIRRAEFRVVPELEQRVALLKAGEVDFVIDVPAERLAELRTTPGLRVITERGLRVVYLGFDTARARSADVTGPNPLRDRRARRALALGIDRRAIVDGPLAGHGEVADQIIPPPVFGFAVGLPPLNYDPTAARQLLAEAGYGTGFGITLDYMPGKYRATEAVVRSLAHDLGVLGVQVRPRPLDPPAFFERIERQDSAMFLLGWMSTGGDGLVTYNYLLHSPRDGQGVDNGGGYSSSAVDNLLSDAKRRHRPEERREMLGRVARLVREDMPVVPLFRQTDLYGVRDRLVFEPRVDRRVRVRTMSWR
jgi:peptide/nickel transport system substrate-binding protein